MDIEKIIRDTLKIEGVLSDNPNDKGGITKYGISQAAYPNLNIKNITEQQAIEIYKKDYFLKNQCDKIRSERIAEMFFDLCVNSGNKTAVTILQHTYNFYPYRETTLAEDGVLGVNTINAINAIENERDFCLLLTIFRGIFFYKIVQRNESQNVFLKGWLNRLVKVFNNTL